MYQSFATFNKLIFGNENLFTPVKNRQHLNLALPDCLNLFSKCMIALKQHFMVPEVEVIRIDILAWLCSIFMVRLRPHPHNKGMLYFLKSHFVKMTLLKSFRLNECDLCNFDLKSCQFIYIQDVWPTPSPPMSLHKSQSSSSLIWTHLPASILKMIVDATAWQLLMSFYKYAETYAVRECAVM